MEADHTQAVEDLTIMLMYLTSWREHAEEARRCWKGYDFDVLDALAAKGLIESAHRNKSAYLTSGGEERATHLLRQYGIVGG